MITRYLTVGMLAIAMTVHGQSNEAAVKPEVMNDIYLIGDSNHLNNLEKGKATMVTKTKLAGFGGSSIGYTMDGLSSSVRINASQPQFATKMSGAMGDPTSYIKLYKFRTKDKEREASISSSGAMGKNQTTNTEGIAFLVKNPSEGVYILIPEKPLEPGEYGFVNMMMVTGTGRKDMSYAVFAFGIDR